MGAVVVLGAVEVVGAGVVRVRTAVVVGARAVVVVVGATACVGAVVRATAVAVGDGAAGTWVGAIATPVDGRAGERPAPVTGSTFPGRVGAIGFAGTGRSRGAITIGGATEVLELVGNGMPTLTCTVRGRPWPASATSVTAA